MRNLKEDYKRVKDKIKKNKVDTDKDGRAIVRINIKDADSLLSVYNDNSREIISSETALFIDNVIKTVNPKDDIHLKISCEEYTSDKEQIYKNAITQYYLNEFADKERKLRQNTIMSITTLILAIISFVLLQLFTLWNVPNVIYQLMEVVSWVFAWETIDLLCFQRRLIKYEQIKDVKIIFAKISFKPLEKPENANE